MNYMDVILGSRQANRTERDNMKANQDYFMSARTDGVRSDRSITTAPIASEKLRAKINLIYRFVQQNIAKFQITEPSFEVEIDPLMLQTFWDGLPSTLLKAVQAGDINVLNEAQLVEEVLDLDKKTKNTYRLLFKRLLKGVNFSRLVNDVLYDEAVNGVGYLRVKLVNGTEDLLSTGDPVSDEYNNLTALPWGQISPERTSTNLGEKLMPLPKLVVIERIIPTSIDFDRGTTNIHKFRNAQWVSEKFSYPPKHVAQMFKVSLNKLVHGNDEKNNIDIYEFHDLVRKESVWVTQGVGDKEIILKKASPEPILSIIPLALNTVVHYRQTIPTSTVSLALSSQSNIEELVNNRLDVARTSRSKLIYDARAVTEDEMSKFFNAPPGTATPFALKKAGINKHINEITQHVQNPPVDPVAYDTESFMNNLLTSVGYNTEALINVGANEASVNLAEKAQTISINAARKIINDFVERCGEVLITQVNFFANADQIKFLLGPGAEFNPLLYLGRLTVRNKVYKRDVIAAQVASALPYLTQIPGVDIGKLTELVLDHLGIPPERYADFVDVGAISAAAQSRQAPMRGEELGTENDPDNQGDQGVNNTPTPTQMGGVPPP